MKMITPRSKFMKKKSSEQVQLILKYTDEESLSAWFRHLYQELTEDDKEQLMLSMFHEYQRQFVPHTDVVYKEMLGDMKITTWTPHSIKMCDIGGKYAG